ncbi:MAG: ABC transporter substrate-binding protein [Acidobacteriota bacterium]|nr:ABC transporter substrate-binding protein [Acidobacteriota bacterium]
MRMSAKRAAWLCAIAASALSIAGCGSSGSNNTEGVTATSVTFGTHQPLTGPAAPGYDEIAPASEAFFKYVDAHGGVYGRDVNLVTKNDEYNPTQTVNVVHQLVLQEKVFGIFEGLGTPTHTKVVGFLNASKVPDLFVASGCPCWDSGATQPYTFGWQPNYTIEGKVLGQYIAQHFAGKKVGVLYQDDDFGQGGLAGIKAELPASAIVSTQPYQPGTTTLAPEITAIKAAGAQVLVDFTVPIYTAIGQLTSFTLGYSPQLVVSSVGIDPTTVASLLKTVSKGKASGTGLIEGAITAGYLPSPTDTANPWIKLFKQVHGEYDAGAPFDGNVVYGMASAYTLIQALQAAGKSLTREGIVKAIEEHGASWQGPGLVPYRYSKTEHGGYSGVEVGHVEGGKIVLSGQPLVTEPAAGAAISPYQGTQPAPPAGGIPAP